MTDPQPITAADIIRAVRRLKQDELGLVMFIIAIRDGKEIKC